jgi:hypothetical protein
MATVEDRLKELDQLRNRGLITAEEYQARRAAIIQEVGTGGGGGGSVFKWGAIGCLSIFGAGALLLIVAVVLIAVAVSGSKGEFADTRVALAIGASGSVETAGEVKTKVTVEEITEPATSTNPFDQPQVGNHYLTIAVTIENVGERETHGGDFKLRMKDGIEYNEIFATGFGRGGGAFQNLTSGGRTSAVLAFEVKDGSEIEWLKFDPSPLAKGDLYFDGP